MEILREMMVVMMEVVIEEVLVVELIKGTARGVENNVISKHVIVQPLLPITFPCSGGPIKSGCQLAPCCD
jgi:hypothetical protein